jgi:hypothetical protein
MKGVQTMCAFLLSSLLGEILSDAEGLINNPGINEEERAAMKSVREERDDSEL